MQDCRLSRCFFLHSFFVAGFFFAVAASAQQVAMNALPDAPVPQQNLSPTSPSSSSGIAPTPLNQVTPPLPYARLYDRTIFTNKRARPLLGIDKLKYAGEEMIRPINVPHALVSAEFSQFQDGDPKYGTDFGAYEERFGAAMLRETTYRLFADGLFPMLLHEDPRYYRMDRGPASKRLEYAFTRTFVTKNDAGRWVPNYATLLGHGAGAALTLAYYPETSQGGGVVLRTFGDSIAVQIGLDMVREFAPKLRWLL